MELLKALKSEYGGISQAQAEKLLNTVQELVDDLSDEVMEALAMGESEEEMGPMFGANIKFNPPTGDRYDALDLSYLSNVVEDAGAFNLGSSLSFKLDSLPKAASDGNVESNMIDTTWLEETLREAYPDQQPLGLSVAEFATTILDMLSSKRSSEELQTELFDLCGFNRFDMIGVVLENREALVKSLKQNKLEMRAELSR